MSSDHSDLHDLLVHLFSHLGTNQKIVMEKQEYSKAGDGMTCWDIEIITDGDEPEIYSGDCPVSVLRRALADFIYCEVCDKHIGCCDKNPCCKDS